MALAHPDEFEDVDDDLEELTEEQDDEDDSMVSLTLWKTNNYAKSDQNYPLQFNLQCVSRIFLNLGGNYWC